jgi:hypothetical protein
MDALNLQLDLHDLITPNFGASKTTSFSELTASNVITTISREQPSMGWLTTSVKPTLVIANELNFWYGEPIYVINSSQSLSITIASITTDSAAARVQ